MNDNTANYKDKRNTLDDRVIALKDKTKGLILSDEFQSIKITKEEFKELSQLLSAESAKDIDMYKWNVGIIHRAVDKLKDKIDSVKSGYIQ